MTDILALEFSRNPQRPQHPRGRRTPQYTGLIISAILGLVGAACKPKALPTKPATQSSAASAQTSATGAAPWLQAPRRSFVKPEGPAFAIMAGEGLGPVRFGATVATIERLVEQCAKYEEQPVVKQQFVAECQLAAFGYANALRTLKAEHGK